VTYRAIAIISSHVRCCPFRIFLEESSGVARLTWTLPIRYADWWRYIQDIEVLTRIDHSSLLAFSDDEKSQSILDLALSNGSFDVAEWLVLHSDIN
jgi:hypothetical protein